MKGWRKKKLERRGGRRERDKEKVNKERNRVTYISGPSSFFSQLLWCWPLQSLSLGLLASALNWDSFMSYSPSHAFARFSSALITQCPFWWPFLFYDTYKPATKELIHTQTQPRDLSLSLSLSFSLLAIIRSFSQTLELPLSVRSLIPSLNLFTYCTLFFIPTHRSFNYIPSFLYFKLLYKI